MRGADGENYCEIFEFAAAVRIVDAQDWAGCDFSVSRLPQAGTFARRGADAEFFCRAWIAGIFFVRRGSDRDVWGRVAIARIVYAACGAIAGDRDVRGALEGAYRA